MDLIRIRGLEFDCIVGLRPHEREREQRVHLDLTLGLDLSPAGRQGRIALTCDYDEIATEVMAMLRFRRYQLIEMATEELAAMLLGVHPALEHVEIRLDKPAALDGRARAASVEIRRTRADFPPEVALLAAGGTVETLLSTRDARLLRVSLPPGASLGREAAPGTELLEWLVDGAGSRAADPLPLHAPSPLSSDGAPLVAGPSGASVFRCVLLAP